MKLKLSDWPAIIRWSIAFFFFKFKTPRTEKIGKFFLGKKTSSHLTLFHGTKNDWEVLMNEEDQKATKRVVRYTKPTEDSPKLRTTGETQEKQSDSPKKEKKV